MMSTPASLHSDFVDAMAWIMWPLSTRTSGQYRSELVDDITGLRSLSSKHPNFEFVRADITEDDLDLHPDFDYVLAADVLYHITTDLKFERAMQMLRQALKMNVLLIISDVFPDFTHQPASQVFLRSFHHYEEMLHRIGLEIKCLEPIFVALQPPLSIPGASLHYRASVRLCRVVYKLLALPLFETVFAGALAWLDEKLLLRYRGKQAYAVKWLLAVNPDV